MVPVLHSFLEEQLVKHKFLVLNQTDSLRFNRAALINVVYPFSWWLMRGCFQVGWYEADRVGCDYLVMHDVDIVPLNPALNYRFPGRGIIRHISAGKYHPIKRYCLRILSLFPTWFRYNYKRFIGGVLMLTMGDYQSLNGMSNKYWG